MVSPSAYYASILLLSTSFYISSVASFQVTPNNAATTTVRRGSSALFMTDIPDGEKRRRLSEFTNLEPRVESEARRERLAREESNEAQFAQYGDDLWELRANMETLSEQLMKAINKGDKEAETSARQALRKAERMDPELMYQIQLEMLSEAEDMDDEEAMLEHQQGALDARSRLPHLNLEGLWVGK